MKKLTYYLLVISLVATVVSSCMPIETGFDETLLIGYWNSETLNYRYDNGGSGVTWDTADDVSEAEAQAFTWTLDQSTLTHIYIMELGGSGVPKVYTITKLTSNLLEYKDDFGTSYSFTKVN